ncbi:hypothetical protein GFJ94_00755 [Flavobacterium sp. LMO8]|uniref:hypothetical protein n=1 Tax=Flavobacterium sp. LMO8 TaxID=2654244 RepID=UPI0012911BAD|nr:hypothetical protein [Flavobacterium sp. LMO8]MQP23591.1 hypothetical protein [Flavobacterium sp. LMO8]
MKNIFLKISIVLLVILSSIYFYISSNKKVTPKEKLLIEVENQLKNKMKDPSSYELISFEKDNIKTNEESSDKEYYELIFRAKNSFGAFDIEEVKIETIKNNPEDYYSDYTILSIITK